MACGQAWPEVAVWQQCVCIPDWPYAMLVPKLETGMTVLCMGSCLAARTSSVSGARCYADSITLDIAVKLQHSGAR